MKSSLDLNKLNITGAFLGFFSGFLISAVPTDALVMVNGLIFGIISAIFLFRKVINSGKLYWKPIVWITLSGVSWYAAMYTFIFTAEASVLFAVVTSAVVGVVILFLALCLVAESWSIRWFVGLIFASICISLISFWISTGTGGDFDGLLDGNLDLIHILWEGLMLYLAVSYIKDSQHTVMM